MKFAVVGTALLAISMFLIPAVSSFHSDSDSDLEFRDLESLLAHYNYRRDYDDPGLPSHNDAEALELFIREERIITFHFSQRRADGSMQFQITVVRIFQSPLELKKIENFVKSILQREKWVEGYFHTLECEKAHEPDHEPEYERCSQEHLTNSAISVISVFVTQYSH